MEDGANIVWEVVAEEEQESAEKEAERIVEISMHESRSWTRVRDVEEAKLSQRLDEADAWPRCMAGGELEKMHCRLDYEYDEFAPFPTAHDPHSPFATWLPLRAKPRTPLPQIPVATKWWSIAEFSC